ncbi:MAG: ABC transporter permease [Ancalomicrobiaceae bacterium]|nr:ABC transporter permease [Ancalomicrobiaceae bacterium]
MTQSKSTADAAKNDSTGAITRLKALFAGNDVFLILIAFVVLAAIASPSFLTAANLSNLLTQSALLGILSVGQFLVVVIGGFDLSVAAVMALSSLVFAKTIGYGFAPAAMLAIAAGAGCGIFNGLVVTWGRVQPLIATLAMMGIARGLALTISERSVLVSAPLIADLRDMGGFLSVPTVIWFIIVAIAAVLLASTRQALHVFAIGGNETTSRLAGVAVEKVKLGVFATSGLLSGIAGVVLVIRSNSGVPLGGSGWELDTIAAIAIGGTNLFGGEGKLLRAMAGVLIYQLIANVMNLMAVDPYYQNIVRAAVIICAVGLSILRLRSASRRAILGR